MPKWLTIQNKADRVEILIYDQIGKDWFGGDGVSAKEFAEALREIPDKTQILVCINSPGGNVWDGLAIYNQLKARRDYVTARIDGIAASIASIIALAGKSLEMPQNALLMIHDPSGMVMGDAEDMRDMAVRLDTHADLLAGIYAEKTGKSREYIRDKMRVETIYNGEQAHAAGFADSITEEIKIAASFPLTGFRRVPAVLKAQLPAVPAGQTHADQMNKKAILALLTEHGKPVAEDAKDEIILAALADLVTAGKVTKEKAEEVKTTEPPVLIAPAEFRAMQARLKEEKEARIKSEFIVLAADRPYLKEEVWLPRLYKDETLMAAVKEMAVVPRAGNDPATNPVLFGVQNNGNDMIETYRKMEPGAKRMAYAMANWHSLEQAHASAKIVAASSLPLHEQVRRLQSPQAANTYSATLVTDRLADGFITTIGTKLAPLRAFSTDFGVDRYKPRATVQVTKATATSAVQTNPTNFELGDSTTVPVTITVNQISKSWHVTNDELNKGHRLEKVIGKNAQTFANAISDLWTALLTVGNFGAVTSIGAAGTFDNTSLPGVYGLAKNYGMKNLILDGGHLAELMPLDKSHFRLGEAGAFGFDLIAEQNRWTGAAAGTVGFVADTQAIALASGLPLALPSGQFIELGTVTVPGLELTVQIAHWFALQGRVHWMSYDVMFGASVGDETAGEVLTV